VKYPSLVVALALTNCVAPDGESEEYGEADQEVTSANGVSLNGVSLNGVSLNGVSLNGASLAGVRVTGGSRDGIAITGVTVKNSQISGTSKAAALTGANLVRAQFSGVLVSGATIALRIDAVKSLAAPNADLTAYTVSYQTTAGWTSLCGTNDAIASPGTWSATSTRHQWDSNMFTLSCRTSTFTKCLELGYKDDSVLDTYHQACIRALRADYCGDGTPHTLTGTEINIYDKLGKQTDTQSWLLESNWNADGATCIARPRIASTTAAGAPLCIKERAAVACPTTSWGAALIRTEVK
jgi:ADYC domain/Pentapeptide repeats (8 copies)